MDTSSYIFFWGECKLHVGIVATTRVALPTSIKLGNCTKEDSRTMFNLTLQRGAGNPAQAKP